MKSIRFILLIIFTFLINLTIVKAVDEYELVQINSNGNILVKTAQNHDGLGYDEFKDDIVYGRDSNNNRVLIINPGVHVDYINTKVDLILSTNNKKAYVNVVHSDKNLTVKYFNAETYLTNSSLSTGYSGGIRINSALDVRGNLSIENSTFINNLSGDVDGSFISYKDLTIKDSTIDFLTVGSYGSTFDISDSTIYSSMLFCSNDSSSCDLNIKNSAIDTTKGIKEVSVTAIENFEGTTTIDHSDIVNNGFYTSPTFVIKDSELVIDTSKPIYTLVSEFEDLTIQNSSVETYSKIYVSHNLNLSDSSLFIDSKINDKLANDANVDLNYTTALTVINDIELNNSHLKVKQIGNVPSFIIGGKFISDDDALGFVDFDNNILELKKVSVSENGYLLNTPNSPMYINAIFYPSTFTEGYALFLNDEISDTFENKSIDTITFKIKNGTWEDGTDDDVQLKIIRGTTINKDLLKSKGLSDDLTLVITKTGENEYTYEYVEKKEEIENPKTGVKKVFILLILALFGVPIIIYNRNKFSLFKKI